MNPYSEEAQRRAELQASLNPNRKLSEAELIELLAFAWACLDELLDNVDAVREFAVEFSDRNAGTDSAEFARCMRAAKQFIADGRYSYLSALGLYGLQERIEAKRRQLKSNKELTAAALQEAKVA